MLEQKAVVRSLYLPDSVEMVDNENSHSMSESDQNFRTVGNLLATEGLGLATFGVGCHFYLSPT